MPSCMVIVDDGTDKAEVRLRRVLTSGGQATAAEGAAAIAEMIATTGDAIDVLPGSGIRADNVGELLTRTKARQVHASASGWREQASTRTLRMGPGEDHRVRVTDGDEVLALVTAVQE